MGNNIKRKFYIGSEWLYLKIYGNPIVLDEILIKDILIVVNRLIRKELIERFFYIRYEDPDFHLRLRFKIKDVESLVEIIKIFNKLLARKSVENQISNFQIDTYQREIERYGIETIELVEKLFCFDSLRVLELLKFCTASEKDIRWLFGVQTIHYYFNLFDIQMEIRLRIMKRVVDNFKTEFNIKTSKYSKVLLKKYKSDRDTINDFFLNQKKKEDKYFKINKKFFIVQKNIMNYIKQKNNENSIEDLVVDIIHVSINRLFIYDLRLSEMVSYEYLLKFYTEYKHNPNFYKKNIYI